MIDARECIKARFETLLGELRAGIHDAKFHAQALAYKYAVKYGVPEAIDFYNALNFSETPVSLDWIDRLPETADWKVSCTILCLECVHRMLTAVCFSSIMTNEELIAHLMVALDASDGKVSEYINKALYRVDVGEDWYNLAEQALIEVDSILSTKIEEVSKDK